ncbi:unnamed protein product [Adineta ricciae]|uniref:Cytochrome P450 n=1 Tax=Adineta ricciae TaxID=249248 RepID=A0A815H8Q7_ADIRI|nr:unnamed protein product [Adineta ricciae]
MKSNIPLSLHGSLPGLSPHFLFGNLIQAGVLFRNISVPNALRQFKARYGDVFQFWLGSSRIIVVSGVEDVQHVLTHRHIYDKGALSTRTFSILFPDAIVCCKGAKYKRHAAYILTLFRRTKVMANLDLMIDHVDKLLVRWRANDIDIIHQNILQQCQYLVLGIFGFIAFDYDLEILNGEDFTGNELTQALQDFVSAFQFLLFSPSFISSIYLKFNSRYRRAREVIKRHLYQIIEQELTENEESLANRKRTCFIASLVTSLQENESLEASKPEEDKKGLSRQEVLDEMLLFLVAGFETTATALAWFIHLMSKHPRVQSKIKAELASNGGTTQDITQDRLDSLVYLDCVVNEVLRFCPPLLAAVRTVGVDDVLPQSGAQLHEGDEVLIPIHNLARDTRLWSIDPDLFYPERFLEADKNHHPYALLPFSTGHRQCIGQDLARFELKVLAARLMQNVTFTDGGPQVNSGGHFARVSVMPKHIGVKISFDY